MELSTAAKDLAQVYLFRRYFVFDGVDADTYSGQWSWFNPFSWGSKSGYQRVPGQIIQKPRKVPVKVEPKVFFANERTFLAWLHMSVTMASISMAIVA